MGTKKYRIGSLTRCVAVGVPTEIKKGLWGSLVVPAATAGSDRAGGGLVAGVPGPLGKSGPNAL
jgi:hypothetical protein